MLKKILLGLLILITIALGVGTVYFYIQNKNNIDLIAQTQTQMASVQATLDAIGNMVDVYQPVGPVYSGKQIQEGDLIPVSVPQSSLQAGTITDVSSIIGKYYKIDLNPGTTMTQDLIMEEETDNFRYERDLVLETMPLNTVQGDFIDIRILMANGEDYVVLNHKEIKLISNTTIKIYLTEEEWWILNSAFIDYATYQEYCVLYVCKYVEPGLNTDTAPYYPVGSETINLINNNENIIDKSRCINEAMRAHIDQQFGMLTISTNQTITSKVKEFLTSQGTSILATQQTLDAQKDDDNSQEVVLGSDNQATSGDETTFNDAVNDAMDSLGNSAATAIQ